MEKALIVEKLEEAFDTKGESIKKYIGTHIYSDIMETKVSVKVGGAFEYPTLNEAITMKIQGKEIIYLNPKPTRVFAPTVLEEKVFSSETDDIKTETTNVLNTNSETPEEKTLETEQVKDILEGEVKETTDVDTTKPTEEAKPTEKTVVKPFVKPTK